MDNHNLEFIVDKDRDSDELDDIRIKLFVCLLGLDNIYIKKYINYFNNTILLNFVNENNIIKLEIEEKLLFLKFLDMFQQNDIFISCNKHHNNYMKLIFGDKIFIILRNIFMYCKGNNITLNQKKLITGVNSILDSGVNYYDNLQEIDLILGLKNLKKVKIRDIQDINKIFEGKVSSNYFLCPGEFDIENVNNLKESKLMKFPYLNNTVTAKYYLINSLIDVGNKNNLPDFSLSKILHNINHHNFFETFSKMTYSKICDITKKDNLKIKKFNLLEEAIGFNIMLSKNRIHGIMIVQEQKFNICYLANQEFTQELDLINIKEEYLKIFTSEEIKNYELKNKNLYYLTNVVKEKEELITPDNRNLITPMGNIISIDILENRNLYCYNLFNDLLKLDKNHFKFNRDKVNIDVDIKIQFTEKIDFIYSLCIRNSEIDVVLEKDIFVDGEIQILENKVRKMWKKGYFLTDFAVYRYGIMGTLKDSDIKFPKWFVSKDGESYQWLSKTLDLLI